LDWTLVDEGADGAIVDTPNPTVNLFDLGERSYVISFGHYSYILLKHDGSHCVLIIE
jgi:hypothetical protein